MDYMKFTWNLPINWCHSGLPLGNGLFGAMVWGTENELCITVNRSDYWLHGQNLPPHPEQSYENVKKFLMSGNEAEMKRVFGGESPEGNYPVSSTRLPMGRLAIRVQDAFSNGVLELDTQNAKGKFTADEGTFVIETIVPRNLPLLALSIAGNKHNDVHIASIPASSEDVMDLFRSKKIPPFKLHEGLNTGGWIQKISESTTLCVLWETVKHQERLELFLTAMLAGTETEAMEEAITTIKQAKAKGFTQIASETGAWWNDYWNRVPQIKLPDDEVSELYYLGMYRLGGLCAENAPAATLQGPWIEDYRIPPWGSDYHFNINVQECYWPVFAGNVQAFILPLFDMLSRWEPRLKEYARHFAGVEDGIMLPHAVDDRGIGQGGFWPGHIDHSCSAWVAQLMWQYWKYTRDQDFLQNRCYPFMRSVMNVYAAMLQRGPDGQWEIQAESSPEYNENQIDAWGKNPTIHLAAIHFLIESLLEAADILAIEEKKKNAWLDIRENLPMASITENKELGIWDGQALTEPHRHFSHLAVLHPFDILDRRSSTAARELLDKTVQTWVRQGTGLWSGWSFPWASIIFSRLEMPIAAHTMLSIFRRSFLKNDYALRYLPDKSHFTSITGPSGTSIMQIEAGMASAAAVMEMCVHTSRNVIYPFVGIPEYWSEMSFTNIRTEGAFLVSGVKTNNVFSHLTVTSECGGKLNISIPDGTYLLDYNGERQAFDGGGIYEKFTGPGDVINFNRI